MFANSLFVNVLPGICTFTFLIKRGCGGKKKNKRGQDPVKRGYGAKRYALAIDYSQRTKKPAITEYSRLLKVCAV